MSQAALFYCGGAKKLQFLLASLRLGQLESAEVNALGIRHVPEVEGNKITEQWTQKPLGFYRDSPWTLRKSQN